MRRESARERTLLRLIEQQQRTIDGLVSQVMHMAGHTWTPPPVRPEEQFEEEPDYQSAFHGLPPTEEFDAEPDR